MLVALVITIVIFVGFYYVGFILSQSDNCPKYGGTIVINTKDPKKDIISIELEIPIGEMLESDQLTFKVSREDL